MDSSELSITFLQDFSDASVISFQLHFELVEFLVQSTQVAINQIIHLVCLLDFFICIGQDEEL